MLKTVNFQEEGEDDDDEFGGYGGGGKEENDGIWCQHGQLFINGSSSGDVVQVSTYMGIYSLFYTLSLSPSLSYSLYLTLYLSLNLSLPLFLPLSLSPSYLESTCTKLLVISCMCIVPPLPSPHKHDYDIKDGCESPYF